MLGQAPKGAYDHPLMRDTVPAGARKASQPSTLRTRGCGVHSHSYERARPLCCAPALRRSSCCCCSWRPLETSSASQDVMALDLIGDRVWEGDSGTSMPWVDGPTQGVQPGGILFHLSKPWGHRIVDTASYRICIAWHRIAWHGIASHRSRATLLVSSTAVSSGSS